jgi:hypothetical protein
MLYDLVFCAMNQKMSISLLLLMVVVVVWCGIE